MSPARPNVQSSLSSGSHDELTATIFEALQVLPQTNKANFLLDTALALIESGQCVSLAYPFFSLCRNQLIFYFRYGAEVESYLEVFLKTPGLPKTDVARAYVARGSARRAAGEKLLLKAQQGVPFSQ